MSYCSPAICLYKYYIFEGESHVQEGITTDGTKVAVFKVASSSVWNPHPDFDFNGGNKRACGEDERAFLTTAAGILAIVFCYTYFYGRLEIAFRKEKEQAVQACKMKQYRTILPIPLKSYIIPGLGKIWKI